jgi:hypothetical protein
LAGPNFSGFTRSPTPESRPESDGLTLEERIVSALRTRELAKSELAAVLGQKGVSGQLKKSISMLLERKVIGFTIPEKPGSGLQKYRITAKRRAGEAPP